VNTTVAAMQTDSGTCNYLQKMCKLGVAVRHMRLL